MSSSLAGKLLGKYRVSDELGRGGMGTVYRAEAAQDGPAGAKGAVVALKVFHPELVADERAFQRFQLEADIGKQIRHDHLVRTYEVARDEVDGQPYHFLVLELIEGKTLKDLLAELGTFPENLLFQVSDQVLGALQAIHDAGIVHRDIKPENVVITPDHRVLLMDLGVARQQTGREMTQAGEFIGSLSYAPPEQFTAVKEVGPRSDLYAFGVSLFELATGENPFGESDLAAVLQKKLQEEVPSPRTVLPELDAFWDEVITTCTRSEAAARFASARELQRILQAGEASEWWRLKAAGRAAPSAERALKRLRLERATPLVGRTDEMARLRAGREQGGTLLIAGPTGVGKSRLLFDYLESIAGAGGPAVAAGRSVGEGGRAYQPFIEALGDLLAGDESDPAQRRLLLEQRLGEPLAATPGVVGPFAEFLMGKLQPGGESGLSKDALHSACAEVVRQAAADQPVVLAVEDLHLAGAETHELFGYLARRIADAPVLLVGVCADDEVAEDAPLKQLAVDTLTLENLPATGTEALVRAVVGHEKTVRALGPTLQTKSEGSPLIVLEVLQHLQRTGALVESNDGLDLAGALDEIAVPSSVRDLAGLKLASLDEEQRETLEAAAVLGAEFDATLLAAVLEEKLMELSQRLAGLERKHRLLQSSGKDAFRFASRQLFETVYEAITPALRSEYHALVADTLLEECEEAEAEPAGATAYALLRHLFFGERSLEAAPYLDAALDFMAANFHASFAAPFLEKVAGSFDAAPPEKRFALAMRLWAFYELLGSRKEQMRILEAASAVVEQMGEPGPRAQVHAYLAGSHWYAGDFDKAGAEADEGLSCAREAGDRKWEATCYHTRGVVAYRRGELEQSAACFRDALALRREIGDRRGEASTLQALAIVMPRMGAPRERVLETMQEARTIWREIGERRGEAAILNNLGNHLVDDGRYDEGIEHLEQAVDACRDLGALLSEANAHNNLGRALDLVGRIDDARDAWGCAIQLYRDLKNPTGEASARVMLGSALRPYGEREEARTHLISALELVGSAAKDRVAEAHRELGEVLHAEGQREEAWEHFDRAIALEDEIQNRNSRFVTVAAAGHAALNEGDVDRAVELFEQAAPDAREAGNAHTILVFCRLARAYRRGGRQDEARALADEAKGLVDERGVPPQNGPEILYTLREMLGDDRHLAAARDLIKKRAAAIRHGAHREYFLNRAWPNPTILEEARQVLD